MLSLLDSGVLELLGRRGNTHYQAKECRINIMDVPRRNYPFVKIECPARGFKMGRVIARDQFSKYIKYYMFVVSSCEGIIIMIFIFWYAFFIPKGLFWWAEKSMGSKFRLFGHTWPNISRFLNPEIRILWIQKRRFPLLQDLILWNIWSGREMALT